MRNINRKHQYPMRKLIIASILILSALSMTAQQLPFSSQYYANMFVINPAYTGTGDNTNAFITHRSQWTGTVGAPQTSYVTLDGPVDAKKIGLGLKLYSDVTDITSRMGAFVNYSYRLKVNEDNNILFGLAVGVLNNRIDFSKAIVRDTDDPYLLTKPQSKTVFSSDFGLVYNWTKLEVGFCIPQLLGNKIRYKTIDGDKSYFYLSRYYLASVKYTFDVIKEKEITAYPLITLRCAKGAPVQFDINGVVDWKKIGWFGITFHSNYALALSAGVRYKNLSVGYAYDIGVNKVKSYMGSSSEFLLSYTFGGKKIEEPIKVEEPIAAASSEDLEKLKVKSDTTAAEISRLKAELAELKTLQLNPPHTEKLPENLMRTASTNDFLDMNGQPLSLGFYIVIGTFSNKENADKLKSANITKGYTQTIIFQNTVTKVFYVSVLRSDSKESALSELTKYKTEYPDTWIQKIQ